MIPKKSFKILITITFVFLSTMFSYSQKFFLKPEFSPLFSCFTNKTKTIEYKNPDGKLYTQHYSYNPLFGGKYGLNLVYRLDEHFSFESGMSVIYWGCKLKMIDNVAKDEYSYLNLNYRGIELPSLVNYNYYSASGLDLFVTGGFGYKQNFKIDIRENSHYIMVSQDKEVYNQDTSFENDYDFTHSLGFILKTGLNKKITENLGLSLGLEWNTNLFLKKYVLVKKDESMIEDFSARYHIFAFNYGIIYHLGNKSIISKWDLRKNRKGEFGFSINAVLNSKVEGVFFKDPHLLTTMENSISDNSSNISTGMNIRYNYYIFKNAGITTGIDFFKLTSTYSNSNKYGNKTVSIFNFESTMYREVFGLPLGLSFRFNPFHAKSWITFNFMSLPSYSRYFKYHEIYSSVPPPLHFDYIRYKKVAINYIGEISYLYKIDDDFKFKFGLNYFFFDKNFMRIDFDEDSHLFYGNVYFKQGIPALNIGVLF